MTLLDEAMAMVLSGEASSPFAAIEVVCNLLSSCARVGDLARADQWTRAADRHLGLGIDAGPAFLYAHCRSNLGLILCDVGPLGRGRGHAAPGLQQNRRMPARGSRGRCAPRWPSCGSRKVASTTPSGCSPGAATTRTAVLPLAALHLARQRVARRGRRRPTRHPADGRRPGPRRPTAHDLRRGRTGPRQHPSRHARTPTSWPRSPSTTRCPSCDARSELARGRVAEASGETAAAAAAYQAGLRVLADNEWPLLRAELHLALARLLADGDAPAAITEARAAHLIYDRLGSPLAGASALLLNSLGVPATARPRRADATAALSRRESEVLDLLRDGLSNADIAARQHNSVRTIEHHVSAILTKLGLRSRAEAAAYAASLETIRRHRAPETEDAV